MTQSRIARGPPYSLAVSPRENERELVLALIRPIPTDERHRGVLVYRLDKKGNHIGLALYSANGELKAEKTSQGQETPEGRGMMRTPSLDPVWAKGESLRGKRKDLTYRKLALFPELVEAVVLLGKEFDLDGFLEGADSDYAGPALSQRKAWQAVTILLAKAKDIMAQGQMPEGEERRIIQSG